MADFFEEDFEDLEGDTGEELPYVASTQEQTSQLKEREWNLLKERFKNQGYLEGIEKGKEELLQAGFDSGFEESSSVGYAFGEAFGFLRMCEEILIMAESENKLYQEDRKIISTPVEFSTDEPQRGFTESSPPLLDEGITGDCVSVCSELEELKKSFLTRSTAETEDHYQQSGTANEEADNKYDSHQQTSQRYSGGKINNNERKEEENTAERKREKNIEAVVDDDIVEQRENDSTRNTALIENIQSLRGRLGKIVELNLLANNTESI